MTSMNARMAVIVIGAAAVSLLVGYGCGPKMGPDVNPEKFQTIQQAATQRKVALRQRFANTGVSVLKLMREDLTARPAAGEALALEVTGDGYTRTIDLSEVEGQLGTKDANDRSILRDYVQKQLPAFDQARLKAAGLARVKKRLQPLLVNRSELSDLANRLGGATTVPSVPVIGELQWVVADFPKAGVEPIAIGSDVIAAWGVKEPELYQVAQDNLRDTIGSESLRTTMFGSEGRMGTLAPGTNSAVIILKDFLPAVRRVWQAQDDVVLLVASRDDVRFLEKSEKRLIGMVWPQWTGTLTQRPNVLCGSPLLLTEKGFEYFQFEPATKPATKPVGPVKPVGPIHITH